jgi:uncharacterized protein YigE (DUF2233 family)
MGARTLLAPVACAAALSGAQALTAAPAAPARPPVATAQGTVNDHSDWKYWDLTVDLATAQLAVALKPGGAFLGDLVPAGALAAINGGYFLKDYRPAGWLLDAAGEYGPRNRRATKGGVFALRGAEAYIGKMKKLPFDPDFAVQNGPLLLEASGVIGIHRDDGKRAPRTAVCLTAGKELHLIVIVAPTSQGPTLMETAMALKTQFDCSAALNLDGGPSTGIWLPGGGGLPPPVPIGYGIVIRPR